MGKFRSHICVSLQKP